eukprot:scaffold48686_cov60-Cyclotella_meneghiniana.AAC.1
MVLLSSDAFNAQWREQQAAASVPINNRLTTWRRPATSLDLDLRPSRLSAHTLFLQCPTPDPHLYLSKINARTLFYQFITPRNKFVFPTLKCESNENDLKSCTDKAGVTDIQLSEAALEWVRKAKKSLKEEAAALEEKRLEEEAAALEEKRIEEEAAALEKKRLEEEAAALPIPRKPQYVNIPRRKRLKEETAALEKKRLEEEATAAALISVNDEDKENAVPGKIAKKPRRENDELVVHDDGARLEGIHRTNTHADESQPYEYSTTLQDLAKRYASMIIVHQEKVRKQFHLSIAC